MVITHTVVIHGLHYVPESIDMSVSLLIMYLRTPFSTCHIPLHTFAYLRTT
jgi:hypothetical protein